jgi:hypothetical protein
VPLLSPTRAIVPLGRRLAAMLLVCGLAFGLAAGPATADSDLTRGTPPGSDAAVLDPGTAGPATAAAAHDPMADGVFTIAVFGDSLADGIWGSIYRRLQRDDRFEILRGAKASTGIARPDYYDWNEALEEYLATESIDAAIFSIGLNDMQSMVVDGERAVPFRSDRWNELYRLRIERLMDKLAAADVATFWIGLPIMRSGNYSQNIAHLNGLIGAEAAERGVPFIPLWDVAANEDGEYSDHLRDLSGRTRQMRANDGIHFTPRGYDLLAHHVLDAMRQELAIFQTETADGEAGR